MYQTSDDKHLAILESEFSFLDNAYLVQVMFPEHDMQMHTCIAVYTETDEWFFPSFNITKSVDELLQFTILSDGTIYDTVLSKYQIIIVSEIKMEE